MQDAPLQSHPATKLASPFCTLVAEAFSSSTRADVEPIHYVNILNTGHEALLARIHLIRGAQCSVEIQTYIWMYDEVGRLFIHELFQAAERGVKVKLLIDQWVDAVGTGINMDLVAFMASAHPNFEVQYYNPSFSRLSPSVAEKLKTATLRYRDLNQRMHNKIFIVDGQVAITGGRNYQNDYYDRSSRRNFKDRDVLVIGPVVRQMEDSFHEYWASTLTVPSGDIDDIREHVKGHDATQYRTKADFSIDGEFIDIDEQADNDSTITTVFVQQAMPVRRVRFVADKPGKNRVRHMRGGSLTAFELRAFLGQADHNILIQSPYLVLDKGAVGMVKDLKRYKPHIDLRVSTNSLAATDNLIVYSFSHKQRKQFVRDLGFRLFELKPVPGDINDMLPRYADLQIQKKQKVEQGQIYGQTVSNAFEYPDVHLCIHAKTFVVDDDMTWIGSYNVDPRSEHLNTEVGLMIWDRAVAQAVKDDIERDISPANSWTIAKAPTLAVRTFFSAQLSAIMKRTKLVKFWPFRYTHCYELKESKTPVPSHHRDFYENYTSVGPFPQVKENTRDIEIALVQAFGPWAKELV